MMASNALNDCITPISFKFFGELFKFVGALSSIRVGSASGFQTFALVLLY